MNPAVVLRLAASDERALDALTTSLAARMRARPQEHVADVAHGLELAGCDGPWRRAVVCVNRDQALAALCGDAPGAVVTARTPAPPEGRPVAFLFPGLGDHQVDMAAAFYRTDAVFRAELNRCCNLLTDGKEAASVHNLLCRAEAPTTPTPPRDLRALFGRSAPSAESADGPPIRPWVAHTAVFVFELALVQTLASYGVEPSAMLGYSLGEYVSACVAGVMTPGDAIWLLRERARLIEAMPAGGMLAVALSESEAAPFLGDGIHLAAINASNTCVLAGLAPAVQILEQRLAAEDVPYRRVNAGYPFHTPELRPWVDELTKLAAMVALRPPGRTYVSSVTGDWIAPEQAVHPAYWARHTCEMVRFQDGLRRLIVEPTVLLEVGPGQALAHYAKRCADDGAVRPVVLTCVPGPLEPPLGDFGLARTLAALWVAGVPVPALAQRSQHLSSRQVSVHL